MKRTRIHIVGESGSGLLSVGFIAAKALKAMGYHLVADREYPSLIKGGNSRFMMNVDDEEIRSLSGKADVLVALDKKSLIKFLPDLVDGGVMIHGYEREWGIKKEIANCESRNIRIISEKARTLAESLGGNVLMSNMVLLGMLWKVLGLDFGALQKEVEIKFAKKPKLLAIDLKILKSAYEKAETRFELPKIDENVRKSRQNMMLIDGAHALAYGGAHAGVRMYVGYPMSPSTGILKEFANMAGDLGIAFKQAEDEITASNMALGGMYAGTRALTATSGGGFDLMTETVSLSGITETPLVIIIAQRPGPATGLPTWTAQADLHLAIYGGHGEFARLVVAVSDPQDCFELIQQSFNLAETFQIPVMILTDKMTQESWRTMPVFAQNTIPITRGLVEGADLEALKPENRYEITENGVSRRWVPTSSPAWYFANGDEHDESGTLSEEAEPNKAMIAKRIRKLEALKEKLPEPELYGDHNAEILVVGWGSTKNAVLDALEILKKEGKSVKYLHYSYVWPLKTEKLKTEMAKSKTCLLLEGNATGQLHDLIKKEGIGREFDEVLLKWNGRGFEVEEVVEFITNNS